MKNKELVLLIQAVPEDVELDYDGKFIARIHTNDHIFECQFTEHQDWFGKTFFNIENGMICDSGEGKEIETTDFQGKMICEAFRPLLHNQKTE